MEKTRVLIVDDEEELTTTLVERLEIRGFACEGVLSGAEALRRLQEREVDVMVLDLKMPGLGGQEVIRRVKELHPRVEVILLTGHSAVGGGENGHAAGAFEYVLKPVKIDVLADLIRRAAERHGKGEEA